LTTKKTLINCPRKRFAALGGAQKFVYRYEMSHFLCSGRLAFRLLGELISVFLARAGGVIEKNRRATHCGSAAEPFVESL